MIQNWRFWAILAAVFAATTAILAKIGVEGTDPDLATRLRTLVVALALGGLVWATGKLNGINAISGRTALFWSCQGWRRGPRGCAIFVR